MRPCEIYSGADLKKRTVTIKEDAPVFSYIMFNEPGHCVVCRRSIKMHLDDKPLTTIDPSFT